MYVYALYKSSQKSKMEINLKEEEKRKRKENSKNKLVRSTNAQGKAKKK